MKLSLFFMALCAERSDGMEVIMNKGELVTAISEKTNTTKKFAEESLNAFIDVITEELKKRWKNSIS